MREREREKKRKVCVYNLPQCLEGGVGFESFSELAYVDDFIATKTVYEEEKQEH